MSTVLWVNILVDHVVESDESDKYALYKHSKKLDKLSRELGVVPFLSVQDTTDMRLNLSGEELPEGMESTTELMARDGAWVSGAEAADMLERLMNHISSQNVKFGIFSNDAQQVLAELEESLLAARKARDLDGRFNFAVVM